MVIMQQPPEITVAYLFTEHLAKGPRLMEMILERGNMFKTLARVHGNKAHRKKRISQAKSLKAKGYNPIHRSICSEHHEQKMRLSEIALLNFFFILINFSPTDLAPPNIRSKNSSLSLMTKLFSFSASSR